MQYLERLGEPLPRRIAVVRALRGLGDLLCLVPAVRSLRAALPEARVTLIGLPNAWDFVHRFSHYFDDLLEFGGFPGIPEVPARAETITGFLAEAQSRQFDLALQMHGNGLYMNQLMPLLGARTTAGFYLPGLYNPDPGRYMGYPTEQHEVRKHLGLMSFLGMPSQGEHLEFPLTGGDREALRSLPEARALTPGEYVIVHPGAHQAERRWPPERFAIVANRLAADGLQVVLTGNGLEIDLVQQVQEQVRHEVINLAGRTSLGALAALMKNARLLISSDTGVSHLAAALKVPSVVIFVASDPARWAPLDRCLHRTLGVAPAERGGLPGDGRHSFSIELHPCAKNGNGKHAARATAAGAGRCLADGCLHSEAFEAPDPQKAPGSTSMTLREVTPEMALAEIADLLAEARQAAEVRRDR